MVKALPNTSFLPVPKSAPAGHTTAAAHLLWQVFPRYPCLEYKDNSGQSCPVRYTWTTSFGRRLMFWQKWFYLTPQFVAYQFPGHLLHPPLVFYCIFLYLSGFVRCSKENDLHLENGGTGQAGVCSFAGPFFHTAEKIRCISVLLRFMSE